jgi:LPXTG-site transpeptidase (sortase) family protein
MILLEKKRNQGRRARRRTHDKRRRTGLFVFIGLVVLILGALVFYGADRTIDAVLQSDVESVEQVSDPTPGLAVPEPVNDVAAEALATNDEEGAAEAEAADLEADLAIKEEEAQDEATPLMPIEDEAAPLVPEDDEAAPLASIEDKAAPLVPDSSIMYLTIPKLGIANTLVSDDVSEEGGLAVGVGHLPGTGFPWIPGSNTYIAGHRIGYPGTPSDHIFFNLPSMVPGDEFTLTDSLGQTYTYAVTEVLQVEPTDLAVTAPTGSDTVSLQVCIENYGDFTTLGPNWNVRLIVRGVRVA